MHGMVNDGGTNPAIPASGGAPLRQIGRGSMSKKSLVWVALIAAAVVGVLVAGPPTRVEAVSWTGWTTA